jgi:hypothetical protein
MKLALFKGKFKSEVLRRIMAGSKWKNEENTRWFKYDWDKL